MNHNQYVKTNVKEMSLMKSLGLAKELKDTLEFPYQVQNESVNAL